MAKMRTTSPINSQSLFEGGGGHVEHYKLFLNEAGRGAEK